MLTLNFIIKFSLLKDVEKMLVMKITFINQNINVRVFIGERSFKLFAVNSPGIQRE